VYSALRERRPYKSGMSHGQAMNTICLLNRSSSSQKFDSNILYKFETIEEAAQYSFELHSRFIYNDDACPLRSDPGGIMRKD
jgi:HD-GYP domain-containing protein (c-di-GMP phosphodiesterase class II)